MALNTFGGGGDGGSSTPILMPEETETIYLGRVVTGAWADVTGGVTTHVDTGGKYTFDTNVAGAQGVYFAGAADGILDSDTTNTTLQMLHTYTIEMVASMWSFDGSQTGVLMAGSGESEAANVLYTIRIQSADAISQENYWETGTGTNQSLAGEWTGVRRTDTQGWHHWATTVASNGNMRIYCDGALVATVDGETIATGGTVAQLAIGSYRGSSGTQWNGVIRDVRISDVVLTPAQILASANASLGA